MKTKRALKIVVWITLTASFLAGFLLLSTSFIKNRIRQNVADEAIEAVESVIDNGGGELIFKLPVSDYLRVDGEDGEEDRSIDDLLRDMENISAEHENITLLGILEIPCIELKEPIWD